MLRAFAAVARTGSFQRAADSLKVRQPAVSDAIRRLESRPAGRSSAAPATACISPTSGGSCSPTPSRPWTRPTRSTRCSRTAGRVSRSASWGRRPAAAPRG
ncbi:LysR family transcriptional regulator [Streptomyces diastatochromogenes]|nr:LysR family transcriptional regulator [Streptomyces diastatochromogenes]